MGDEAESSPFEISVFAKGEVWGLTAAPRELADGPGGPIAPASMLLLTCVLMLDVAYCGMWEPLNSVNSIKPEVDWD